jgi:hypothetical protein
MWYLEKAQMSLNLGLVLKKVRLHVTQSTTEGVATKRSLGQNKLVYLTEQL